jgi:hypothetical protein
MPTKLRRLKAEALESCEYRDHDMSKWYSFSKTAAYAQCLDCGKQVVVDTQPLPNGIEIFGEAVALGCED